MRNRLDFSKETRLWVFRRSIFGSSIEPLHTDDERHGNDKEKIRNAKLPQTMAFTRPSLYMPTSSKILQAPSKSLDIIFEDASETAFSAAASIPSEVEPS